MSAVSLYSHSWHWHEKRPQKQATSSSSYSLPLGGTWMGEAKHGLERTRKHRMCSDFNRVCPGPTSYGTMPKPGCEQNPKRDIAANVTVTLFTFLVPICMVVMLAGNTATHPGGVPHPHLTPLRCWECGSNGVRLLTSFWNGIWCWNPYLLIISAKRNGSSFPLQFLLQPPCSSPCPSTLFFPLEQKVKWKHFYLCEWGKTLFKKAFQSLKKISYSDWNYKIEW